MVLQSPSQWGSSFPAIGNVAYQVVIVAAGVGHEDRRVVALAIVVVEHTTQAAVVGIARVVTCRLGLVLVRAVRRSRVHAHLLLPVAAVQVLG